MIIQKINLLLPSKFSEKYIREGTLSSDETVKCFLTTGTQSIDVPGYKFQGRLLRVHN